MEKKNKEGEIDLLELAYKLWDNKRFIIKVTLIGAIVGLIVAFSIPKEYTTTVVFTTNSSQPSTGNMGALASFAGINLTSGQSGDVFPPELYPNVMSSTPFVKGLLNINVNDQSQGIDTTLYSYLKDNQRSAWWSYLFKIPNLFLGLFADDGEITENNNLNPYFISKDEMRVMDLFKDLYNLATDKKTGVTTLEVTTQDPRVSALLADTLTLYLQEYIIKERTKKAKTDLANTEKLYYQSQKEYNKAQENLAVFLDRNKQISSALYGTRQKRLESDVTLAHSLYSQMAQQLQLNRIKVQDDTPVFTIIQPAIEALRASKPSKLFILIVSMFLSVAIGSIWILKEDFMGIYFKRSSLK